MAFPGNSGFEAFQESAECSWPKIRQRITEIALVMDGSNLWSKGCVFDTPDEAKKKALRLDRGKSDAPQFLTKPD
jgi:hypothetical protein